MAQTKIVNNIKKTAIRFRNVLEKKGIPIERMIIFGSYAKGKAKPDSDIDICIVSPKFGKDSIEELQFLLKQRRKVDSRIEPIPISSLEYRETSSPLIFEIKKFGKEIKNK
jgi:predicted nucleotidyltransferase